jgi:hypothetical protein
LWSVIGGRAGCPAPVRVGQHEGMSSPPAPPPVDLHGGLVVAPDVIRIDVTLVFDVTARRATAKATVELLIDGPSGRPALDLRQTPTAIGLDGRSLDVDAFAPHDLGGGTRAEMRVLDVGLDSGTTHRLTLGYDLDTPDAAGAEPIGWETGGVRFDLWMSDLEPGRYLEMWIPSPLCHDRFELRIDLTVTGTDRPHTAVTNAGTGCVTLGPNHWWIGYPAHFTSLSPMLVVAPADAVEASTQLVAIPGRDPLELRCYRHVEVDADLDSCRADIAAWLPYLTARYGPWAHAGDFTAFVWGPGRGMEYDGATTAAVGALEHEVFHSWFGRGVKPACASDGWIDEAWTTWSTTSSRSDLGRFAEIELGLDEEPVLLYPPHPWSRFTPRPSYALGARLWAGLATQLGGADRLRSAMAAWYCAHAGQLVTTDGLETHLAAWSGVDVSPWWNRYVHGRG